MEDEKFCSGYCRQMDRSRMVAVVTEDGKITEVDYRYGSCAYQSDCPIAKEIDSLKQ